MMATTQMSPELPKPSFAKAATSAPRENSSVPVVPQADSSRKDMSSSNVPPRPTGPADHIDSLVAPLSQPALSSNQLAAESREGVAHIATSLNDLSIGSKIPSLVVYGSGSAMAERARATIARESTSDESLRADSSSELGTKPPSLDEKSITSGTTFALDEKESLRPDDSASVKAAAEDDDAFSIRGSLLAGSRMGSDVAARARGIQLGDIAERRFAQPIPGPLGHGVLTPQSASSEQPPGVNPAMPLRSTGGSSDALNVIYRQAPDEKLLDALASPRDRYFLLRLEKDVIDFVQDSKEPYMDLPPSNSFCRMLTHKLADYYHMTHSYEPHIGSVRIFRTPFCRVPPSLALMVPPPNVSNSSTPPPAVLPKKIMRRGQDSEGEFGSAGASKGTSENGSDGKDGKDKLPFANQKLSREEREEMYKLARERIFGSSEENIPENDSENGISRASSVSANKGKRSKPSKQRRDDSDSFDSRHQYTPYWGPQQQTWVSQPQSQFMPPANNQYNPQPPQAYPSQMAPAYGQQSAAYPGMPGMPANNNYPAYPPPQFPPQSAPQRYHPGGSPMTTYGSPAPPAAPPQNWQPGFTPPSYQPRGPATAGSPSQSGVPYAYGQLPANSNPHDPKSQHPIPGSYSRGPGSFNPQTQSFVPGGNGMPPIQAPQPPYTAPGSHHGSPQIGTPHLAFAGYQPAIPQPYGGGYGMVRQGSNTSMPAYHTPPHAALQHAQHALPMQSMQHALPQHLPQHPPAHIPSRPNIPHGPNQIYNHMPNYGNPATLPQKPATGI